MGNIMEPDVGMEINNIYCINIFINFEVESSSERLGK